MTFYYNPENAAASELESMGLILNALYASSPRCLVKNSKPLASRASRVTSSLICRSNRPHELELLLFFGRARLTDSFQIELAPAFFEPGVRASERKNCRFDSDNEPADELAHTRPAQSLATSLLSAPLTS